MKRQTGSAITRAMVSASHRRASRRLLAVTLVLALTACQANRPGASVTQPLASARTAAGGISESALQQDAARAYARVVDEARRAGTLNPDAAQTQRVRAIVSRLAAVTPAIRADAKDWAWEAQVVRSDARAAWCLPGGKVMVNSALIPPAASGDDELAAALAHVMAHALRDHFIERLALQSGLASPASAEPARPQAVVPGTAAGDPADRILALAADLPYGRGHEAEADRIGVELMARAGYDPRAAVSFWKGIEQAAPGDAHRMSHHSYRASRVEELALIARRVMPLYEQASGR